MQRTAILDAVLDACVQVLDADRTTLTETTAFAADLDADSLALVEVVMELEEAFDLQIPEQDLESVTTIGSAVDLIAQQVAVGG